MLFYKAPGVMDARRASAPNPAACADKLFTTAVRASIDRALMGDGPNLPLLCYITRKKEQINAAYFLQRYGRDYFARPARVNVSVSATIREGYPGLEC